MWAFFLFALLWTSTEESDFFDLLSTTDRFLTEFHTAPDPYHSNLDVYDIKMMLKRTYGLVDERRIFKRSSNDFELSSLLSRETGVYLLSDIEDITIIPAKFPNDINVLPVGNVLLVAALEANGSNPEIKLANDLVLYEYSPIDGIKEIGRVPVLGGLNTAIHSFRNTVYVIAAEHEASPLPDSFEGSALYKIVEERGHIVLEKVQILNVIHPNHVKFWEHQNEFYLVVASNAGNDTSRTGTLIYRWMGYHFDCIQQVPGNFVKHVEPFTMGSFMYLAIANYQDEYGNTDIFSAIYRFNLDDLKFYLYQRLNTHGAQQIVHFSFEDEESKKSEHFLAVANYIGKNTNGALTSFLESVVYKFNGNHFVPFQGFKLLGATQWLPVKGSKGEFLLLVSHSNGLRGYQYDGWRFAQVSLKFSQSALGGNVQSMRTFEYFGDLFLTIADKSSHGESVNLWKLSFENKNELQEQYNEVENWCQEMMSMWAHDNITQMVDELKSAVERIPESKKLVAESLKVVEPQREAVREIKNLTTETEKFREMLSKAEKNMEKSENDEIPIVIGSKLIPHLEVKCETRSCVAFNNLEVHVVNGEDFTEFMSNIVSVDEGPWAEGLTFDAVSIPKGLFAASINGHPSATIVDVSSESFVNSELVVNGTVFINNDLHVHGNFDGMLPDENHLLLYGKEQQVDGKLNVNTLKVDNLKVSGLLNKHPIDELVRQPEIHLQNNYNELNVNNLNVGHFIDGYNVTHLIEETVKSLGNQEIQGDLNIDKLVAEEVVIDSDELFNVPLQKLVFSNPCLIQSPSEEYEEYRGSPEPPAEPKMSREAEKNNILVVVEGHLQVNDIHGEEGASSLQDIINNSYLLSDPVINEFLVLADAQAGDATIEMANGIPVDSWVSLESSGTRNVTGNKLFSENVWIGRSASVNRINHVDLRDLGASVLDLKKNQELLGDWSFDSVFCHQMLSNATNLGTVSSVRVSQLVVTGSTKAEFLQADSIRVADKVDDVYWNNFLEDSIFDSNDFVEGIKTVAGNLRIEHLNLTGRINDFFIDELIELDSKHQSTVVIDKDVQLENSLNLDDLNFEGTVDSILRPHFKDEWLLQDENQIVLGRVFFESVTLNSGSRLKNETINNLNIKKLFSRSVKINEDAKIKYLYALDGMKAREIEVGGTVNGADFKGSVLRSKAGLRQDLSGGWLFEKNLDINGSLTVEGFVSGLNLTHLCGTMGSEKINLVVGGGVRFQKEPSFFLVNGVDLAEVSKKVWMKNENFHLTGNAIKLGAVELENECNLQGYLNNINFTLISGYYLSKTVSRVVSGATDFDDMVIGSWCRMRRATVEGTVNGIDLSDWSRNVLLQDENQTVTGKLTFGIFETSALAHNGTINRVNLSDDVLRYDVENAVVEGEKTFDRLRALNLTLSPGNRVQGVDVDAWRNDLVSINGDAVFDGSFSVDEADFKASIKVSGKFNGMKVDRFLLKNKNQKLTGMKHFKAPIKIKNLKISGTADGLDVDSLLKNQAYSDRDLVFTERQTFTKGFDVSAMNISGTFQGVNVSAMCQVLHNPIDLKELRNGFASLTTAASELIEMARGRAFFLNHFESVQTLKPNVRAVVPTIDSRGLYLAVLSSNLIRFLKWNEFSESFVNAGESLTLNDNITFVTSAVTDDNSFLYLESSDSGKIFMSDRLQEIEAKDTSCVASFRLKSLNKTCIFIGQKENSSRILCSSIVTGDLRTYQWLESKGSVQATVLTIDDDVYLAVINKEEIVDKFENSLTIYRFDSKLQHFHESHTLAEVNPVAVSSISYKGNHYLVSAGGHLPESVHNSIISIFRFNKNHKVFVRSKSIQVDTPVDVHFALLPSSELALYVLTSNPTKPLVVYLHRGIAGFVEETSGLSLYPGSHLYSFTDHRNRHFVVISGFGRGQVLKAEFKGAHLAFG